MVGSGNNPPKRCVFQCAKLLKRLRKGCFHAVLGIFAVWAALAVYFAGPGPGFVRGALAAAFIGFTGWVFCPGRNRSGRWHRWLWVASALAVAAWFLSIRPSHDREWRGDLAVLPGIIMDGNRARISGFRDFEYRSRDDFTARYREREVELTHLTSVDLFISYWKPGAMAHTFLSFRFDNAAPVCISIEARREKGERFAALASLFKRFELIYVVGDERDIVRVRTNHRGEEVYIYPLRVSAEAARRLFLVYVAQINKLAVHPEHYNLLNNSCTANIVRNAAAAGRKTRFDIRFLLNGLADTYLYEENLVDSTISLEELRRSSRITETAKSARDADFSERIRAGLPSGRL